MRKFGVLNKNNNFADATNDMPKNSLMSQAISC